jgi:Na+:H+ antiporter, NhaA family
MSVGKPGDSRRRRDRPRGIVRPLREFLDTEAAGGLALLAATVVALAWANSPWKEAYEGLWRVELAVRLGTWELSEDLRGWINDGAMTLFFFVVGLEIKRELSTGELSDARVAALPVIGAAGGMIVPAALYTALSAGGPGAPGWGIPMATDIAFTLGVLALLGRRLPASLRVFMLTLAIADDIGSILVIAIFYSRALDVTALGAAFALLATVWSLRALKVSWVPAYAALGAGLWLAVLSSGVHVTVVGVTLGLLAPARPPDGAPSPLPSGPLSARGARSAARRLHASVPVAERLEHLLHPWVSYAVLPLFAVANAGLVLEAGMLQAVAVSPVARAVVVSRVVGKLVGITGAAWLAVRLGIASRPPEMGTRLLVGGALLAAVGFTVPLFVARVALPPALVDQATLGLLLGSVFAAALGAGVLLTSSPR